MNLPNKLTLARLILVPVIMVFIMFQIIGDPWSNLVAAALFLAAALTDMFDGRLARKYDLVTDFGKFIDPLADKFLVIGAMLSLCSITEGIYQKLLIISTIIVVFRELAVTSLRLLVSGAAGIVIAANVLGKIKTTTQIVFVMSALIEPVLWSVVWEDIAGYNVITYTAMAVMAVMTVWSGVNYVKGYWKYLDPKK
ncbi:MAG: CDP-diacylglycerol--glycerol-3-phosphate 3-phosphatidyltransferase [Clostridia bacterium]|nr:CDP-diacylglycerol--glycerol-3-phosphate 3-phosphatidyltransferase [Clostridia bacterium]